MHGRSSDPRSDRGVSRLRADAGTGARDAAGATPLPVLDGSTVQTLPRPPVLPKMLPDVYVASSEASSTNSGAISTG